MAIRVGINGFGRIGRSVFRILADRDDIEVVAINDLFETDQLVYLLKYDSVMGNFEKDATADDDFMYVDGKKIAMTAEKDPAQIPWGALGVDVVVESTGVFTKREALAKHLEGGAKKVILTVPPKDDIDAMIVMGVNDDTLKPEHKIVSNASCTTNCLAPIAKILDDRFGIEEGFVTTVHAYTNDQRLADVPHKDFRRSRAATQNIIPTTTGAARAVALVMPDLKGRLDGLAFRVPTPTVSVVDFNASLEKNATVESINEAFEEAAGEQMKGILGVENRELVSLDFKGDPRSSIVDAPSTMVLNGNQVKVVAWYDNEWGYSCRVADLCKFIVDKGL